MRINVQYIFAWCSLFYIRKKNIYSLKLKLNFEQFFWFFGYKFLPLFGVVFVASKRDSSLVFALPETVGTRVVDGVSVEAFFFYRILFQLLFFLNDLFFTLNFFFL